MKKNENTPWLNRLLECYDGFTEVMEVILWCPVPLQAI